MKHLARALLACLLAVALASCAQNTGLSSDPYQVDIEQLPLPAVTRTIDGAAAGDELILVNGENAIDAGYPARLLNAYEERRADTLPLAHRDILMQPVVLEAVQSLNDALEADGLCRFIVTSAYRSYERQEELYSEAVSADPNDRLVAPPGSSEHQTGLALDLALDDKALSGIMEEPEGAWLQENAWRYGFIIRYPEDKAHITGIDYEPWHVRYVGRPHAAVMAAKGWCLEEYHEALAASPLRVRSGGRVYWIFRAEGPAIAVPPGDATLSRDGRGGYIVTVS